MANQFDGDVRPLSNDKRYMKVVFSGPLDQALAQARAAKDHGVTKLAGRSLIAQLGGMSRDRIALLQHLNLLAL